MPAVVGYLVAKNGVFLEIGGAARFVGTWDDLKQWRDWVLALHEIDGCSAADLAQYGKELGRSDVVAFAQACGDQRVRLFLDVGYIDEETEKAVEADHMGWPMNREFLPADGGRYGGQ